MADKITGLPYTRPIVNSSGVLTQEARSFFRIITERSRIIGEGSPEGVISAIQGADYLDTTGSTGALLYVKQKDEIGGDTSKGWVLV